MPSIITKENVLAKPIAAQSFVVSTTPNSGKSVQLDLP